jgi:hypothetical protein
VAQGSLVANGTGYGNCTGALMRYPVTAYIDGLETFVAGPAQVTAQAAISESGFVVGTAEWSRAVEIQTSNVP